MHSAISPARLKHLNHAEKAELAALLEQRETAHARREFFHLYPDHGPLAWTEYKKHLLFFEAGAIHRERCFMGANRIGKTKGVLGYETTCHLTGHYPHWWVGRRFPFPIEAWMAGKTNETTRDILQVTMFGPIMHEGGQKRVKGTGLIPYADIGDVSWKSHDLMDTVTIRHHAPNGEPDGWSILGMKSYQQGRGSFEGTAKHVIGLDEEPEGDEGVEIYTECLTRTMTTEGIIMLSFTPLEGLSKVVTLFMPGGQAPADGIVVPNSVGHVETTA